MEPHGAGKTHLWHYPESLNGAWSVFMWPYLKCHHKCHPESSSHSHSLSVSTPNPAFAISGRKHFTKGNSPGAMRALLGIPGATPEQLQFPSEAQDVPCPQLRCLSCARHTARCAAPCHCPPYSMSALKAPPQTHLSKRAPSHFPTLCR